MTPGEQRGRIDSSPRPQQVLAPVADVVLHFEEGRGWQALAYDQNPVWVDPDAREVSASDDHETPGLALSELRDRLARVGRRLAS